MRNLASVIGLCGLVTMNLQAAVSFTGAEITELRPDDFAGGGFILNVSGTMSGTQTNCTKPNGTSNIFFVHKATEQYEALFSLALAAQLAGKKLNIYSNEVCSGTTTTYEGVRYLRMVD